MSDFHILLGTRDLHRDITLRPFHKIFYTTEIENFLG